MCIVLLRVLNLVLLCVLLGSVVEAAPQAQPKTTWNAQEDFVRLRVLLGIAFHVFVISARFPFPCQKRFLF